MAAYFTGGGAGTDVQAGGGADGLQTLYLMNPNYVGYADAAAPAAANMMLLNSAVSSLTPASFGHHHHQPAQHFVGIPLQPPHSGYNLWAPATTTTCVAADMTSPRQEGGAPSSRSAVSAVLSLSSREAPPVTVAAVPGTEARYMGASPTTPSQQEQVVMSSRYLKAAQELLDEAVSVGKGVEEASAAKKATVVKKKEDSEGWSGGGAAEDGGSGGKSGGAAEMSTAERQEVQTKKSKLLNMLDEVEQRYQQYHHQMQAVASSFEVAAGLGSARTYTALALRTISRQFRCLRDAITVQVRSASRALGEEGVDPEGGGRNVGSRLRFIDHQLRQQRALQQLGMAQGCSGAWRPQRGLPERSVSVLRAWLFEHFLHPYPKDSDKVMLAKQTGLTRSQVSNWFINARVRLWKPMVEEMYLEEAKGAGKEDRPVAAAGGVGDDDGISGDGGRMGNNNNNGVSMSSTSVGSMVDHVHASASGLVGGPRRPGEQHSQASLYGCGGSSGGGDRNDGALFQDRLKKARTTAATTADEPAASFHHVSDVATLQAQAQAAAAARRDEVSHRELLMKFMEASGSGESGHRQNDGNDGGYSLFTPAPYGQFGSEEQFAFAGSGGGVGGVSLTLGLPHGANAAAEQTDSFLMSGGNGSDGAVTAGYDMNMQSTKSLAAQLMRDFVA